MIDIDHLWVQTDVEESLIDSIQYDQKLNVQLPSGAGTFTNFRVSLSNAPAGAAKSWSFTLRVNGAAQATCTIVNAATSCNTAGPVTVNAGDLIDVGGQASGNPAQTYVTFSVTFTQS